MLKNVHVIEKSSHCTLPAVISKDLRFKLTIKIVSYVQHDGKSNKKALTKNEVKKFEL